MARIGTYSNDASLSNADKFLGTDSSGSTKNYSIQNVTKYLREVNASGVAGQFTYQFKASTVTNTEKGLMNCTFSGGDYDFLDLTAIKINKIKYGDEGSQSMINILSILSNKAILIVDVNNHNNFGVYTTGTIAQDGSLTNYYDVSLTRKNSNGALIANHIYGVTLFAGSDVHYVHDQQSASTTWTIAHNLGKFPSVSLKFSTGAEFNNTGALGGVTYTDSNNLTINLAAAESGVAYLN